MNFFVPIDIITIKIGRISIVNSTSILNDNILYLDAWMNYNPSLRNQLKIEGEHLVWSRDDLIERVNIKNFYLPTLLYNQMFQRDIQNPEIIHAEDLFRIIRVHVLSFDYTKIKNSQKKDLLIVNFCPTVSPSGKNVIVFEDNFGRKYQIEKNVSSAFLAYENLHQQHKLVRLLDFKLELEKIQNGSQR